VVSVSGYRYRGPGFDSRLHQIFWVVVVWNGVHSASWASGGQLRSHLNKKCSGSRSRKQRLTAVGISCADHVTPLYPQKLALTSPTGGGRSVGIVHSRTKATEFSLVWFKCDWAITINCSLVYSDFPNSLYIKYTVRSVNIINYSRFTLSLFCILQFISPASWSNFEEDAANKESFDDNWIWFIKMKPKQSGTAEKRIYFMVEWSCSTCEGPCQWWAVQFL
jgi:hypothetical protein